MYNVIIPVTKDDMSTLNTNIKYILRNLDCRKIIILGSLQVKDMLLKDRQVEFIDENEFLDGMTLTKIASLIENRGGNKKRAGWYFQQFLKMGYGLICEDKEYLIWDSDTIPVKYIEMIDNKGKYYFDMKEEFNRDYFKTMGNLLGLKKVTKQSFISEHMIISVDLMRELIKEIEEKDAIIGNKFYEKIINSIDIDSISSSGFSEFETYGTYVMTYYKDKYIYRDIKTLRDARALFGSEFDEECIDWLNGKFSTISIEKNDSPTVFSIFCNNGIFRKLVPFSMVYRLWEMRKNIRYKMGIVKHNIKVPINKVFKKNT